jgi:uncharacterized coiled-coil protein SlyX
MRTIDTSKINLLLIATSSTGVPIGFRELLPDEYPTNGDLFDTHSGSNNDFFDPTRPRWEIQKTLIGGKSKVPYGTPNSLPAFWFKHYRVLEVPDAVPEGYGVVTGGTLQPGDFRLDLMSPLSWAPVHPDHYGQPIAEYMQCKIYRKQPAFPVAPKAEGPFCYGNLSLRPPGVEMKKQFVFDRDYKSGCDKLQAKVNELTKRLRDSETALGVRTEQLGSAQDHIASESALVFARVTALKARIAELEHKTKHQKDMLDAGHTVIAELMARIAELTPKDPGVGEGYRELLPDEFPEPGDEYSSLDEFTNVRSSWHVRTAPRGVAYGKMWLTAVKGFKYRRKLPVPGPAAAPADAGIGEGYRELRDAELPQPGDEFSFELRDTSGARIWVWNYRGWASTGPGETYGRLKRELGAGLRYRRKVRAQ